jgi:hypothetical protein
MTHDDIDTEARRLGELETAFIRLANEVVHLKNEMIHANRELVDMATRLDALELIAAYGDRPAPWWKRMRRSPWCT